MKKKDLQELLGIDSLSDFGGSPVKMDKETAEYKLKELQQWYPLVQVLGTCFITFFSLAIFSKHGDYMIFLYSLVMVFLLIGTPRILDALKVKGKEEAPEKQKLLEERLENLEALMCRLDAEINSQLEHTISRGQIVTTQTEDNSRMPTMFLNVASALEARFQVLRELGRGGMGIVFQALDKQLNEQVAIKILSPLLSNNQEGLARLQREVASARRVTHANVIRIHDISEMNGLHFVSMEYFSGHNLKEHLKHHGPASPLTGYQIASQICAGLEAAHAQGVIHRDLKSQNIIVNENGTAKIIDFGLAHSGHMEGMTATGLILGTPEYMAPEQVAGKKVDERADIYSLGIILFELFTGKVPFTAESAIAVGFKQMKERPPAPRDVNPDLPEELNAVILKALQKDPQKRYRSVADLRSALESALLPASGPRNPSNTVVAPVVTSTKN